MTATNKCYNFVGFGYRAPLLGRTLVVGLAETWQPTHAYLLQARLVYNTNFISPRRGKKIGGGGG